MSAFPKRAGMAGKQDGGNSMTHVEWTTEQEDNGPAGGSEA